MDSFPYLVLTRANQTISASAQAVGTARRKEHASERSGPFWDAAQGGAPLPCAAATLGFEFLDADVGRGTIQIAFAATDDFVPAASSAAAEAMEARKLG